MEHRQEDSWQSLEEELTQQTYTGMLDKLSYVVDTREANTS